MKTGEVKARGEMGKGIRDEKMGEKVREGEERGGRGEKGEHKIERRKRGKGRGSRRKGRGRKWES
jgi:hypothetical protein